MADPARWARGTLASAGNDHQVAWYDPSATKWCAMGAIYRAAYDLVGNRKEATRIGDEVAASVCPLRWLHPSLTAINDARGHAAVLAVFDKALATGITNHSPQQSDGRGR
jgi:hypothetical protein